MLEASPDMVLEIRWILKSAYDKGFRQWYPIIEAGGLWRDLRNIESQWEEKKDAILQIRVNEYAGGLMNGVRRLCNRIYPEPQYSREQGWQREYKRFCCEV